MELTMNSYQKAVQALKECVKDAVDSDINASTQGEIWRHYQGMKAIAKMFPDKKTEYQFTIADNGNINITTEDYYDPDYNIAAFPGIYSPCAADTISFGDTYGKDVIMF